MDKQYSAQQVILEFNFSELELKRNHYVFQYNQTNISGFA